jgi:hypothetical protein
MTVEAVEKVSKQIPWGNSEKSDLIECATINDLMPGKGQVTPESIGLTRLKNFSYRLARQPGGERTDDGSKISALRSPVLPGAFRRSGRIYLGF